MDYFNGLDSLNYAAKVAAMSYLQNSRKTASAEKQFSTMFYSELMKQVINSRSTVFGEEETGYFGSTSAMNDIFAQKMVEQLISSGGGATWQ